jgi:hypothetical protein
MARKHSNYGESPVDSRETREERLARSLAERREKEASPATGNIA